MRARVDYFVPVSEIFHAFVNVSFLYFPRSLRSAPPLVRDSLVFPAGTSHVKLRSSRVSFLVLVPPPHRIPLRRAPWHVDRRPRLPDVRARFYGFLPGPISPSDDRGAARHRGLRHRHRHRVRARPSTGPIPFDLPVRTRMKGGFEPDRTFLLTPIGSGFDPRGSLDLHRVSDPKRDPYEEHRES
eukprot:scaffold2044_cov305-Pavlova_lutheri.AAC.14